MTDELIALLETFNYPVFRQGSLSGEEPYPATFITFWNNDESGHSFYDDDVFNVEYDFDVNVYSNNPDTAYSLLDEARQLVKQHGWTIQTRAYDAMSDEVTHVGRGMRIIYLKDE